MAAGKSARFIRWGEFGGRSSSVQLQECYLGNRKMRNLKKIKGRDPSPPTTFSLKMVLEGSVVTLPGNVWAIEGRA